VFSTNSGSYNFPAQFPALYHQHREPNQARQAAVSFKIFPTRVWPQRVSALAVIPGSGHPTGSDRIKPRPPIQHPDKFLKQHLQTSSSDICEEKAMCDSKSFLWHLKERYEETHPISTPYRLWRRRGRLCNKNK
jgi:hypothetical protein